MLAAWNRDHDAAAWMQESVVWFSQRRFRLASPPGIRDIPASGMSISPNSIYRLSRRCCIVK